jgi:hypothetical protein
MNNRTTRRAGLCRRGAAQADDLLAGMLCYVMVPLQHKLLTFSLVIIRILIILLYDDDDDDYHHD